MTQRMNNDNEFNENLVIDESECPVKRQSDVVELPQTEVMELLVD